MPSTTIHFPDAVLADIDRAAREMGVSRNRYVIEACRAAIDRKNGTWPVGFFDAQLSEADAALLCEAAREMDNAIQANRRNRGVPAL